MATATIEGHPSRWAPPITSAKEAIEIIQTVWVPAVQAYDFAVFHRDPKQKEMGQANRRKVLLALGEIAEERGSIQIAADVREVSRRTGLSPKSVAKHLKAEARDKKFIKIVTPGRSNPAGGFATVYKLLVDRLRENSRGDLRGDTTHALQACNKQIDICGALQAPPSPIAQPPASGPPPDWEPAGFPDPSPDCFIDD